VRAIKLFAAAHAVRQAVRALLPDAERAAYEPFLATLHTTCLLPIFKSCGQKAKPCRWTKQWRWPKSPDSLVMFPPFDQILMPCLQAIG